MRKVILIALIASGIANSGILPDEPVPVYFDCTNVITVHDGAIQQAHARYVRVFRDLRLETLNSNIQWKKGYTSNVDLDQYRTNAGKYTYQLYRASLKLKIHSSWSGSETAQCKEMSFDESEVIREAIINQKKSSSKIQFASRQRGCPFKVLAFAGVRQVKENPPKRVGVSKCIQARIERRSTIRKAHPITNIAS